MDSYVKLCLLLGVLSLAEAFYLPGLAATNFCTREVAKKHQGVCRVYTCSSSDEIL